MSASLVLTAYIPDASSTAMRCALVMIPPMHFFLALRINSQGPEHAMKVGGANAQHPHPSHCTLPMFHPPMDAANAPPGLGYVSDDGHHFPCKNPIEMWPSFHV